MVACRTVSAKPLSEPRLEYHSLIGPSGTGFGEIPNIYIVENLFESVVCEMAGILSRP